VVWIYFLMFSLHTFIVKLLTHGVVPFPIQGHNLNIVCRGPQYDDTYQESNPRPFSFSKSFL
jgi:hypothetical protein